MLAPEVIRKKRDGSALSAEEIAFLVGGITDGGLSDAQVGALAMAFFLQRPRRRRAGRADDGDARLRHASWTGTSTARCWTSTRPAASATRSR